MSDERVMVSLQVDPASQGTVGASDEKPAARAEARDEVISHR